MERLLIPGGSLALLVPAHPALFGSYDRLDGHYRRYTKRSLKSAIDRTNLEIERLHYMNSIGAVGWWIQYRLLRRQIHGARHFRAMNALLRPLRAIERIFHPPFGLSLVAVLRRC